MAAPGQVGRYWERIAEQMAVAQGGRLGVLNMRLGGRHDRAIHTDMLRVDLGSPHTCGQKRFAALLHSRVQLRV